MKAVIARNALMIDDYRIEDLPTPQPGAGDVRIRVHACGLGHVDVLHATGRYQVQPDLPYIPGIEVAGVIDAIGPDVVGLEPGMRVMPLVSVKGGCAQHVIAPASQIFEIPVSLGFAPAAVLRSNVLTALYALRDRARVVAGETVLVFGAAGGVGSACIEVARLLGARVIAAASTPEKRAAALELGAHDVIDTQPQEWRDRLREVCSTAMPDVVFDPVCGPLFDPAFRSLAWNGRYLVVGFAAGNIPSLKGNLPLLKGAALVGVDIRQFNRRQPDDAQRNREQFCQWVTQRRFNPLVGAVFPFERFAEALAHAAEGKGLGKTVVTFD